jgi:hypothetical protein
VSKIAVIVGIASALALLVAAPEAEAHQACISVPDRATACNRDVMPGDPPHQDHYVDACDRNEDGLRTRAWYTVNNVSGDVHTEFDPNGANPGCAHDRTYLFYLLRQRSCVDAIGCSAWLNH